MKDFKVSARLVIDVDLDVKAESLQDALNTSRDLNVQDFIEIKGEWLDSEDVKITGVYEC